MNNSFGGISPAEKSPYTLSPRRHKGTKVPFYDAKTKDVAGFYYAMVKRFPDANLFISNEMNSNVFKGGMSWEWREE